MTQIVEKRLEQVEALAKQDEVYCLLMEELQDLQWRLDEMTGDLEVAQKDLIWDFIMQCEEISARKLVIACRNMEFAEK